jgi:hypothetical protein
MMMPVFSTPMSADLRAMSDAPAGVVASLHPHFCSPGLCYAKPLFGLQKRRQQPERYVK